jgi:uncharacterized integral membrane protein (TIGR00697 family)
VEKTYRYYDLILGAYVCVLLCANLIGPAMVSTIHLPLIGAVTFMAGVLFFPISYVFGDILTEVYGYARDRRVVWSGFAALVFAALMSSVIVHLPPAEFWRGKQAAVEEIFGNTPRYVLKSLWEVVATPLTYRIVGFLKRAEQEDYYDRDTDFTPFSLRA